MNGAVYLHPRTKIEPLVCGWYAWTHLISPAQHALNVAFRHIPLLQSFIKSPSVHTAAAQDPELFAGPFMHLSQESVPEVRQLLAETESRCSKLIALGRSLRDLDAKLQESATGYSLSEFYSRVPDTLAGLVEFLYDLNHHPRLRIQEELLYDQAPGAGTQELMMSLCADDSRTFFMSTPRLPSQTAARLPFSFADPRVDLMASMRTQARSIREVADQLQLAPDLFEPLAQFFTTTAPARSAVDYAGDGVRVRYFGHACVLVQTRDTNILIDPLVAWESAADGRYTFHDLPDRLDYVVLSHNHQDHCVPEVLLQLRHRIARVVVPANNSGNIADPSMKLLLSHLGFSAIEVMRAFDEVSFGEGRIASLPFPGEHVDLDIHSRQGVHVQIKGRNLVFLVDSDGCDPALFKRVRKRISGEIDMLFLGMECYGAPLTWLYGPLLTRPINRKNDESRRLSGLDSQRAWQAAQEMRAHEIYVYAMGQEPWLRHIMGLEYTPDSIQLKEVRAFLDRCQAGGLNAQYLYLKNEKEL